MRISKWETLLTAIRVVIFILGILYFVKNWSDMPDHIISSTGNLREQHKTMYVGYCLSVLLGSLVWGSYFILVKHRNTYYVRKRLSSDPSKSKQQYHIESSCLLCSLIVVDLSVLFGYVKGIEERIKHIYISSAYLIFSLVIIGLIWTIHHVLWIRLADKS
jgi:hypothetical protein